MNIMFSYRTKNCFTKNEPQQQPLKSHDYLIGVLFARRALPAYQQVALRGKFHALVPIFVQPLVILGTD